MRYAYKRLDCRELLPSEQDEEEQARLWKIISEQQKPLEIETDFEYIKQSFFEALVRYRNVRSGERKTKNTVWAISHAFLYCINVALNTGNVLCAVKSIPESDVLADVAATKYVQYSHGRFTDSAEERLDTSMENIRRIVRDDPNTRRTFQAMEIRFTQNEVDEYIVDLKTHMDRLLYQ